VIPLHICCSEDFSFVHSAFNSLFVSAGIIHYTADPSSFRSSWMLQVNDQAFTNATTGRGGGICSELAWCPIAGLILRHCATIRAMTVFALKVAGRKAEQK
jgi:hypothetical protein